MSDANLLFEQRLAELQMAYGIPLPGLPVTLADEAIARAAVCGPFDLFRITRFVDPINRAAVRQSLAGYSDPAPGEPRRLRWLKADRRRAALGVLLADPAGLASLLTRVRYDRADEAGRTLRDLLRGWRPDLRRVSVPRLGAIVTVVGWLQGLTLPPGSAPLPDARSAQIEQSRRDRERARRALLCDGFVGRRQALTAIRKLIDDPGQAGRVLIVAGPGGIGKSALLAQAVGSLARRNPPVPVFHFDFDRPSINPMGPGMTLDLCRQLALYLPEAGEELSRCRALLRGTYQIGGGNDHANQSSQESSFRSSSEAAYMIRNVVQQGGLDRVPVLLVFDTLEVLESQGDSTLRALREWITFAQYEIGLAGVRTIVAGRAAERAADPLGTVDRYMVPPLSVHEATKLLTLMGVDQTRAAQAAKIVRRHPLALRLGGRYLLDHPDVPANALAEGGPADSALTEGIVYKRILNHLGTGPDDPLRKLAYPGLAVRLVTPALIRDVIAPAVGIRLDDPVAARALWQRLVDHTWVVERETDGLARHRRDLREEMLPIMLRDASVAPKVMKLHRLALKHFRAAADPDLPRERARLEAVYHALMLLKPGEELPEEQRRLVKQAMGSDYLDLPPHAAELAMRYAGLELFPAELAPARTSVADISLVVLLQRLLGRISDLVLRKIVHPGLVLRMMTPGLIRAVVAPALGIPLRDRSAARRLWTALAGQTWLVVAEADARLRPRSDLRKVLMRLLAQNTPAAPEVVMLHRLALQHYRAATDPDIPPELARTEAIYHALMLVAPGEDLADADRSLVQSAMQGDFSELSPHAAALARACAGVPPEPGDVDLVPPAYRDAVLAQLGWVAIDGDRPLDALALAPDAAEPWVWRLTAWQNAAAWESDSVRRGLDTLGPGDSDAAERWARYLQGRLEDPRLSAVALREHPAFAQVAGAWLHLARGSLDQIALPKGSFDMAPDPRLLTAMLRQVAAFALSSLIRGEWTEWADDIAMLYLMGSPGLGTVPEPAHADALARVQLLIWAAGSLKPTQTIPLTPAMIAATPERMKQLRGLVADPALLGRFAVIEASYPSPATTARLTGTFAHDITQVANQAGGATIERLLAANIGPRQLIHGLMHEFRPGARFLLTRLAAAPEDRRDLSQRLPALLTRDGFLPDDLAPETWVEAAGRSDGSRAVSALVDWAGRIGGLPDLLTAAGEICSDQNQAERLLRFAAAVRVTDRALDST